MALTSSQIQQIWTARMQLANPRYQYYNNTDKAAHDAKLARYYTSVSTHLGATLGSGIVDLNNIYNVLPEGVADIPGASMITSPPSSTRSIIIGNDANGNVLTQTLNTPFSLYTYGPDSNNNYYLNFYDNTSGLNEVWQFNGPIGGVVNSTVDGVTYSKRVYDRLGNSMNTWDPLKPDMFACNTYYLVNISINMQIWFLRSDPTQTYKWLNGVLFASNGIALDSGLNSGIYQATNPASINLPGGIVGSLVSENDGVWVWGGFGFDNDSSYTITITLQTDGSYKHSYSGATLTPNEWFNTYVGESY
jgi:hypothetical protein